MNIDFRVYLITDRNIDREENIFENVRKAIEAGIRAVQLREKDLEIAELIDYAYELRKTTYFYSAKLIINERVDVALAVGADGVHTGYSGIPVRAVRKIVPVGFMVGVSTHGIEEAIKAEEDGADFITCGPVFGTPSKRKYGAPIGVDRLKEVVNRVDIPVFALGGIKESNIAEVMGAGAYGVSMISAILASSNIEKTVKEIVRLTE